MFPSILRGWQVSLSINSLKIPDFIGLKTFRRASIRHPIIWVAMPADFDFTPGPGEF
jgi:hypothetical protein